MITHYKGQASDSFLLGKSNAVERLRGFLRVGIEVGSEYIKEELCKLSTLLQKVVEDEDASN